MTLEMILREFYLKKKKKQGETQTEMKTNPVRKQSQSENRWDQTPFWGMYKTETS